MTEYKGLQLARLVNMDSADAVFEEVKNNFIRLYAIEDFEPVRTAYNDFVALFAGRYPGYRACNTKYHDKIHTTDALLAISRLIDGYCLRRGKLPAHKVVIALIATIFHDSGYIQGKKDTRGTGAKYTLSHVDRSVDFVHMYLRKNGFSSADAESAGRMILCTGLGSAPSSLRFRDRQEKVLGYMLGSADLLGQMASRTYLERLLYLYREFREGRVKGYSSEYSLLEKTLQFYSATRRRLEQELDGVDAYALYHFTKRYGISRNLYHIAIERQINYLGEILQYQKQSYRDKLRRKI